MDAVEVKQRSRNGVAQKRDESARKMTWRTVHTEGSSAGVTSTNASKPVRKTYCPVAEFKGHAGLHAWRWYRVRTDAKVGGKVWFDSAQFERRVVQPIPTVRHDLSWFLLPVHDWHDWTPWTKNIVDGGVVVVYICCNPESKHWSFPRKMTVVGSSPTISEYRDGGWILID